MTIYLDQKKLKIVYISEYLNATLVAIIILKIANDHDKSAIFLLLKINKKNTDISSILIF